MPNDNELGKLEKVDLKKVWGREDTDFTPWLAREESLALLAEAIGGDIELELHQVEKSVGRIRSDIVCRVSGIENKWVIIENQFGVADHDHLGKLITYAATLGATTLVWIASEIRDEQRSAIDWLNKNTNKGIHFFAMEIELWKIGKSPPAPKFNIIEQPNDWEKEIAELMRQGDERKIFNFSYWVAMMEYLENSKNGKIIESRKPIADSYKSFASIKGNFLSGVIRYRKKAIAVEMALCNKLTYEKLAIVLEKDKKLIENKIGKSLYWKNAGKSFIIGLEKSVDLDNNNNWDKQFDWLRKNLEAFHNTFWPRIKKFNPKDHLTPYEISAEYATEDSAE